tara:strand:+ start:4045 stop:5043 length:999 start_codon:yes stop_codon:yes gene_type:complete
VSDLKSLGEFGLIDRIAAHGLARENGVIKGIGDDCAVLELDSDSVLLVTTDTLVEDIHFWFDRSAPEGLGYKILAVSLSDVAAMGGTPRDSVLSVSAPATCDSGYLERVFEGIFACGRRYGVNIVGGDTTRTNGPLVFSLTLMGRMPADHVLYRSGARPGDRIFVSGTLGDAGAGLHLAGNDDRLAEKKREYLLRRLHRPLPRVELGRRLAESGLATAMIDLSDGLASDLGHLARASSVDMTVDLEKIPISPSLKEFCRLSRLSAQQLAVSAGEDYELALTGEPELCHKLQLNNELTCIGEVVEGCGIVRDLKSGEVLDVRGFDHFTEECST